MSRNILPLFHPSYFSLAVLVAAFERCVTLYEFSHRVGEVPINSE